MRIGGKNEMGNKTIRACARGVKLSTEHYGRHEYIEQHVNYKLTEKGKEILRELNKESKCPYCGR